MTPKIWNFDTKWPKMAKNAKFSRFPNLQRVARTRCTRARPLQSVQIIIKIWRDFDEISKFQRHFGNFTSIQRGKRKRWYGGMQESRNFKIGQNVFKTIIETRMEQSRYHPRPLCGDSVGPSK